MQMYPSQAGLHHWFGNCVVHSTEMGHLQQENMWQLFERLLWLKSVI